MEGSALSEDRTRLIFETETIGGGECAKVNDVIENANHFRVVDYVIDKALIPLSEEFIKCLLRKYLGFPLALLWIIPFLMAIKESLQKSLMYG